jgi:hypothetical protein
MNYKNNTISNSTLNWNIGCNDKRRYDLFGDTHARLILTCKEGRSEQGTKYVTLEQGGRKRVILLPEDNTYTSITNFLKASYVRIVGYAYHEGGYAFVIPYKYSIQLDRIMGNA